MSRHVVARARDIPPGGRVIVELAGRSIGVFNVDGKFFAIRNRCPHQGAPLCMGKTVGELRSNMPGQYEFSRPGQMLRCPWHGWEYDLATGQSWFDPRKVRVKSYAVEVVSEAVLDAPAAGLAPGPFKVESYDVTVEDQLVVVDL